MATKQRRLPIKIRKSVKMVKKSDVQKTDSVSYPKIKGRLPADAGPTFKVKVVKK